MKHEEKRLIQDKYEIVSKIKQGGFGIVYKGYDHVFEKDVAIKAIEPSLLREAKYIDLFLEEAKNAGKLSHNNIVHIYNLVRDESGQFFIIMEYVNGVDLGKILRRCRNKNIVLPVELSVFIIKEICKALEYAHNKRDLITDKPLRLVHQDISPSNIMTSRSGHVKLIDFGLAKIRFQNNNSNEIVVSGKLPYMAPEQLNGNDIDRRTDIFSLGTVFYELLTGSRLFPLDDPQQTIDLIKKSKIDKSLLDQKDIPQSVQNVLLKMLHKDPESRYLGANGVYLDLVECLMSTTHSVELSEELGVFISELMDSNGSFDEPVDTVISPELPVDKEESESPSPDSSVSELEHEVIEQTPEPEPNQFDIKELKIENVSLPDELQPTISEDDKDDDKTAGIEPHEIPDLDEATLNGAEKAKEESPIEKTADAMEYGEQETDFKTAEESEVTQSEILSPDEGDSSLESDKYSSPSKDEEDETALLDEEQEINRIFESNAKSKKSDSDDDGVSVSRSGVEADERKTTAHTVPSLYAEEEGEDDLKTVIDVIRLSTKRHKKVFTIGGLSVLAAIILFLVIDVMMQITSLGEGVYNRLFPPAIRINSMPSGAAIYLDNKLIKGKTPHSIPKIAPGVHELKLTYAGFSPLIKSIHVPSKGEVKVPGEKTRKGYDPYLFRFKSQVEILSDPVGATVYINQLLYPHPTPTTVEWEVGNPLSIELEQEGFQKLSGFALNTLDGIEEIEDRRLWSFDIHEGDTKKYIVEGLFKKFITISCIPSGVDFYIDGSPTPAGRTQGSSTIALSMGNHNILFKKAGFNSRRVRLTVDKKSPESISVMLTRNVRFFAKDKNDPGNNEIGASIVKIIQNRTSYRRNDQTPCEISLPPVNLQVMLTKEGYKDAIVNVSARDKDVVVRMEPSILEVEIIVKDALTSLPLKDAQVSYRSLVNDQSADVYFGATDENGKCANNLPPGEYSFKVKKFGYFEKYSIMNTKAGENKLEFKLIIQ